MKNLIQKILVVLCVISLWLVTTGCGSKYNYYMYTKNAEEALKKGDFKKAEKLISYAYTTEKNAKDYSFEKCAWLFYRLGVIAEVSNSLLHAKGYYWGDQIEPNFYDKDRRIAWLAKTGWEYLDNNNSGRSLAMILELERLEPPAEEEPVVVTKPQPRPKKYVPRMQNRTPSKEVVRKDTPFTYPPNRRARGLFKVAR
jgi:hypothetical protein